MVFSSTVFVFLFLPITVLVYAIIREELRNYWLLLASIVFYAWGEPKWVLLLGISTVVNYCSGLLLAKLQKPGRRRLVLTLNCVFNIGILFYFKYLTFSVSIVDRLLHTSLVAGSDWLRGIVMPIGISFFTFQIMSYVIDVYRGQVPAQRSIIKLALYIMLFPQMIAGPIVRYIDVQKEINSRSFTMDGLYTGARRFMVGFTKKIIISNRMAEIADLAFAQANPTSGMAWLGIVCYALQIFFDFSAYSDMAIGMGHMFGFHFLENFNYPYIALSVQEFWRRWHISLSTWFRDYLYIPLGGNRKGTLRTYRNLLIVFFITGLWHGASWNFIVWGLFHGAFQLLERFKWYKAFLSHVPKPLRWLYAMLVVLVGWVLFRADDLPAALTYIQHMFSLRGFSLAEMLYTLRIERLAVLILGVIFSTPIFRAVSARCERGAKAVLLDCGIFACFAVALLYMTGSSFNPFIYFRF